MKTTCGAGRWGCEQRVFAAVSRCRRCCALSFQRLVFFSRQNNLSLEIPLQDGYAVQAWFF